VGLNPPLEQLIRPKASRKTCPKILDAPDDKARLEISCALRGSNHMQIVEEARGKMKQPDLREINLQTARLREANLEEASPIAMTRDEPTWREPI
jgi:hypothetical protein